MKSQHEAFASWEIEENNYKLLGLDPSLYIALWHEKQMLLDNKWQLSPIPRGFSGGAIINVVAYPGHKEIMYKQVLTGIITEHRKKTKDIEGVLLGTRINVHMNLLKHFMPELFDVESN